MEQKRNQKKNNGKTLSDDAVYKLFISPSFENKHKQTVFIIYLFHNI